MKFAQFYHESTGYVEGSIPPRFDGPKRLIPAVGSDSVMVLDGRWGLARCIAEARSMARARGYKGFSLHAGPSFAVSSQFRAMESC